MKYKPYKKDFSYSYTLGVAPTIALLEYQATYVQEILLSSKATGEGIEKMKQLIKTNSLASRVDDKQIKTLSKSENTYAIGVFNKYQTKLEHDKNHVVLVNPSDTGNLGTIIRTMSGFDFTNLAIISPAVDIWDPKVIRASMGAVFRTNTFYFSDFPSYQKSFSHTAYAFMLTDSQPLQEIRFQKPFSLVFGTEGAGLPARYKTVCTPVGIEQSDHIDSFNLSIAVGIGLYSAYLQQT